MLTENDIAKEIVDAAYKVQGQTEGSAFDMRTNER